MHRAGLYGLLIALLCWPAWAQQNVVGSGVYGDVKTSAVSYSGPGDVVAGAVFWYGLRAYSSALANAGASTTKVMDVRGTTTSGACTIFLLGNGTGGLDLTTAGSGGVGNQCLLGATTFCTVTNSSCAVSKLYDQTVGLNCAGGTTCDIVQGTAAQQPILTFNSVGGNAALTFTSISTQLLMSNNTYSNAATTYTFSSVSEFNGSNQSVLISGNGNALTQVSAGIVAGDYFFFQGAVVEVPAANGVYHAVQAVFLASASSTFYIDGSGTTGNAGNQAWGGGAASDIIVGSNNNGTNWTGPIGEVGFWLTTFSGTQQSNMNSNQHSYWGF